LPNKKVAQKKIEEKHEGFGFRVKLGEYEIEIRGTNEEVIKTIENLPNLIVNIHKAFEIAKPKTVATLTVKTEAPSKAAPEAPAQAYPKIASPASCEEAMLRILKSDWGKWRPRTMEELEEATKANGLKYPGRTLGATLDALAEKGKIRRWNTNTGFVYILAEEKTPSSGGEKR
jgi:hypothetical protein